MEPRLVVVYYVPVRYAYREVDGRRIIWDVEEDKGLSRAHIPVLDALADYIGEELSDDGGGKPPGREGEALAILIDHITFRLNLRLETRDDIVDA